MNTLKLQRYGRTRDLVVGGSFNSAGSLTVWNIALWNTSIAEYGLALKIDSINVHAPIFDYVFTDVTPALQMAIVGRYATIFRLGTGSSGNLSADE